MLDFFPSPTLAWSMAKMFVVRSLAVLFVLILVLQVLDLLSETDKILGVPGNGQAQLLTYVSLRIPELVQRFLPFCVLLGTLVTLVTLNQNSEVIAMKAAGLSAHQVLAPLVLASLGLAVFSFAFNERVVARASATLDRWQATEYRVFAPDDGRRTNVWVRNGDDLINAQGVSGSGRATRLTDVEIFDRQGGALATTTSARRATVSGDRWRLEDVTQFNVATGRQTRLPTLDFGQGITPDRFTLTKVDDAGLSFGQLRAAIAELETAGRPTAALEAGLWHKLSGPLSTILMPLLGAVAAFGLARAGQLFVRAVIGMALGFAYFVADNFALAMGNLGAYPPLLAAWGPFFLFLLIGEAVLIRTEE